MDESGIKIFQADDGKTEIQVAIQADTVWLSHRQLGDLFEKDTDTIGLHLRNIYKSRELTEEATTEKYSVVQKEGSRKVTWNLKLYNLDAIISVGYRVNSKRGLQRIDSSDKLNEDQLHQMASEFEEVWGAFAFYPDFPDKLPSKRKYELTREYLNKPC